MGSGESKNYEILKYVESEWQYLRQQNGVRVLRNYQTDKQAEMVPLVMDPRRDIDKQYEIYNYRRTQEKALVAVYAVQQLSNNQASICGNSQMLRVVMERMPLRYRDLPQIPFPEALYALSESILGFDDCFSKVGQFEITSRMIGVNPRGSVKVWLNENFADNHSCDQKPFLQMTCANEMKLKMSKQELIMLQNLLNVIEEKCESGRFPEDFRARIYAKSNFIDAYNQIQMYCRDRTMAIPDRIMLSGSRLNTETASLHKSNTHLKEQNQYQYEPRETLIKNLSFSQQNHDKQFFVESPHLKKYQVQTYQPFRVAGTLPASSIYSQGRLNSQPLSGNPNGFANFSSRLG